MVDGVKLDAEGDPKHWTKRIILGRTLGLDAPPQWLVDSYTLFHEQVTHPEFPCYFGSIAERRKEMFYTLVNARDLTALPDTMRYFAELSVSIEHEKNNLAVFFEPETEPQTHEEFRAFCWHILQYLHDHDTTENVEDQPLPDDAAWEFTFAGMEMFAVGCGPTYQRRKSRNLGPGMLMLFQPRSVFMDPNTGKEISLAARQVVRDRLLKWDDGVAAHPDTGIYGDPKNREWKQYFLPDTDAPETGKCPFLSRSHRQEEQKYATLPALFQNRAVQDPDAVALSFLGDGEQVTDELNNAELDRWARAVAADLSNRAEVGERVLLTLPSGPEFVAAFLGCLYAGMIAVPAFPGEAGHQHHLARLEGMVDDCEPAVVLVSAQQQNLRVTAGVVGEELLCEVIARPSGTVAWTPVALKSADTAFLQYTSGSTSAPKGVMVTHANIMANERAISRAMAFTSQDVMVSWLPLYHDMGLIGGLLAPLFVGFPLVLMTPQHFLERPSRWLSAVSRFRATVSGGPDFAYQLCLDRIGPAACETLDLASWRIAYCGSEPIQQTTLDGFAEKFAPFNFQKTSVFPCYGMAEATLLISGGLIGEADWGRTFETTALAAGEGRRSPAGQAIVSCGPMAENTVLHVVDPTSRQVLENGQIGELWVSGPGIAHGYWRKRRETKDVFQTVLPADERTYLRTGDLGFVMDGHVYVTGRLKDLIILNGQNVYPQDIERLVGHAVPQLRKGRVAAFQVQGPNGPGIGVAAEVSRIAYRRVGGKTIADHVCAEITAHYNTAPLVCLLLEPGRLPRTSSGKIRRSTCLEDWQAGMLDVLYARGDAPDPRAFDAPATPDSLVSGMVREAWKAVLGKAPDNDDQDFFAAGGTSLTGADLIARLQERSGRNIPLATLFTHRTPRTLGAAVTICSEREGSSGPTTGVEASVSDNPVLSPTQEAMWFLWRVAPTSPAYTIGCVMETVDPMDEGALRRAMDRLVMRHDSLRTIFGPGPDGKPTVSVASEPRFAWQSVIGTTEDRLKTQINALVRQPFDLLVGPLLRVFFGTARSGRTIVGFSLHHIVADGISGGILLAELSALYTEECGGDPAGLPDATPSFYDPQWQRKLCALADNDLAYWRQVLADAPQPVSLARTAIPAAYGETGPSPVIVRDLGTGLTEKIETFALSQGVSAASIFASAYAMTLARYANRNDLVIGMPVSGRVLPETLTTVGPLMNTLPLRLGVSTAIARADYVKSVHQTMLDGLAHQAAPFEKIVAALNPVRQGNENPFFRVMFNMLPDSLSTFHHLGRSSVASLDVLPGNGQVDLTLTILTGNAGWQLRLDGEAVHLGEETTRQLTSHLFEVLTQLVAPENITLPLAQITLSCGSEVLPELRTFDFMPAMARIAEQARLRPAATAVRYGNTALTYGELDAWSTRIAAELLSKGVGPEERVGLCLDRSPAMIAGMLGILRAGAAYVPLDPAYPPARLAFIIADCEMTRIVRDSSLPEGVEKVISSLDMTDAESLAEAGKGEAPSPVNVLVCPDQLAYVIYTSGSTGTPKGVGITHRNVSRLLDATDMWFDFGPTDVIPMFHSFAFDVSVWEIFNALTHGATLVVVPFWTTRDPVLFHRLLRDEKATVLNQTPSAFMPLMRVDMKAEQPLSSIRHVVFAGEKLDPPALAPWLDIRGDEAPVLINMYGTTETTVHATYRVISPDDVARRTDESFVGGSIPDLRVQVRDDALTPVPAMSCGEITISGDGLARGYLGRPGLTAERFVPDPDGNGSRMYRTGDEGGTWANGEVYYLGRLDHQVKIRGFRVELGEIEATLRHHPAISEALVKLDQQDADNATLVAYLVNAAARRPSDDALRTWLLGRMPAYLVPNVFIFLDHFPLTVNGKLDRAHLPVPLRQGAGQGASSAPRNQTERQLFGIWQDVLKRTDFGIHDSFFVVGGDSILALGVQQRADEAELALGTRDIFDYPTIAQQAEYLHQQQNAVQSDRALSLTSAQCEFLSAVARGEQKAARTEFLEWVHGQPPAFATIEEAITHIVHRHDALRMRFWIADAGEWVQARVSDVLVPDVAYVDLRTSTSVQDDLQAIADEQEESLSPTSGHLLKASWVVLPDQSARLVLTVHGLAADEASWCVFRGELATCLSPQVAGMPSVSRPDWCEWVAAVTKAGADQVALQEALGWWETSLAGMEPALTAPDMSREAQPESACLLDWEMDPVRTARLIEEASRVYRLTPEELVVAATVRAVGACCDQSHAIVNVSAPGRSEVGNGMDAVRTVGCFSIRALAPISNNGPLDALLIHTKDQIRQCSAHALSLSLLRIAQDDDLRREATSLPVADIRVRFPVTMPYGSRSSLISVPVGDADVLPRPIRDNEAVSIVACVREGCLRARWDFDSRRIPEERAREIVSCFNHTLLVMLEHLSSAAPRLTVSDFPDARLSGTQLAALAAAVPDIEDIYPTTALQQGLLLQAVLDHKNGHYLNQLRITLVRDFDPERLRNAWAQVVARHTVLRTSFHNLEGGIPVQVVHRDTRLPWVEYDWSTSSDYTQQLDALMAEDRAVGFDIGSAPLMRLHCITRPDGAHDLLWTFHHAVLDGWSVGEILSEVLTLYRDGSQAVLPLAQPYRNYVLRTRDREMSASWWRNRLADVRDPGSLTEALGTPQHPEDGFGLRYHRLTEDLSARLSLRAQELGVTTHTILQAAWACVLSRFSGRSQIAMGTTFTQQQPGGGLDGSLVGLQIQTLPLWVDVAPQMPLAGWLQTLQKLNGELRAHCDITLSDIQNLSGLPQSGLFDSLLIYQNYSLDTRWTTGNDALVTSYEMREFPHYPLCLAITPGSRMEIRWTWDRCKLDDAMLVAVERGFIAVLDHMTADGATEQNVAAILGTGFSAPNWLQPSQTFPFVSVPHQIAQRAKVQPDAIAIVDGKQTVRYADLTAHAARIAHAVSGKGLGADDRVGLCAHRGPDAVAGIVGILMGGAAYVPLDPAYPSARLKMMIEDSGVRTVFADEHGVAALEALGVKRLDILAISDWRDGDLIEPPHTDIHPDQLAYVIYTSGSTGRPKGVAVTHRNLERLFAASDELFNFRTSDVWSQFHSLAFDVSVWEIFGALTTGARLVIVPQDKARDAEAFHALLCREHVTILSQTPTAFSALAAVNAGKDIHPDHLRSVIFAGEKLDPAILGQWRHSSETAGPVFVNMYGITETTVHVTFRTVPVPAAGDTSPKSLIGAPLPDLALAVVTPEIDQSPVFGLGELLVAGPGVTRGYLGRPGLTAERFVPDPAGSGTRVYMSGDLARRQSDGDIEYVGRRDHQVKIRGYRIETGEIRASLLSRADLADAVVVINRGVDALPELLAFVVPAPGHDISAIELRAWLGAHHPSYMVPGRILTVETIPTTINGKLDTQRLLSGLETSSTRVAQKPATQTEALVLAAWCAVLGRQDIGVEDNFFEIGGHSLLVPALAAAIHKSTGRTLPLHVIFDAPIIRDYARLLDENGTVFRKTDILPRDRNREQIPLTPAQARLWYEWNVAPQRTDYTIAATLRLTGPVDLDRLSRAFSDFVAEHGILRTTYQTDTVGAWQMVHPQQAEFVEISDQISETDPSIPPALFCRFDLQNGPLIRLRIQKTGEQVYILQFAVHHIAADAWSLGHMMRDISARYRNGDSFSGEREGIIQYPDYALWLSEHRDIALEAAQLAFWKKELGCAPYRLALPYREDRDQTRARTGACEEVVVPEELASRLRSLAASRGLTVFSVLLSALNLTLYRYTNQEDIRITIAEAGRHRDETASIFGLFVNLLTIRTRVTPENTLSGLLQGVQGCVFAAIANGDVPYDRVAAELLDGTERTADETLQVLFEYGGQGLLALPDLPDVTVENITPVAPNTQADMTVSVSECDTSIMVRWHYVMELFDSAVVADMAACFVRILNALVADIPDDHSINTLCSALVTEPAQPTLTDAMSVNQRLAQTMKKVSETIALTDGRRSFTYGELDQLSSDLACHLLERGVRSGQVIGLACADPIFQIVAMTGVLRAGGAYVSLDPAYPKERLTYIAGDSGAVGIVTDVSGRDAAAFDLEGFVLDFEETCAEPTGPLMSWADLCSPQQPVYLVYTSGSTGQPKGVCVSHHNLDLHVQEYLDYFGLSAKDRVLQFFSTNFDASVEQIFPALAVGATLVVAGPEHHDVYELNTLLCQTGVTFAALPTAFFREWVATTKTAPATLRNIVVGGEALLSADVQTWQARAFLNVHLTNIYGPSEATVGATVFPIRSDYQAVGSTPIGFAFDGREVLVMAADGAPVPTGVAGELCIGGDGIALGYVGRPAQTASVFVPDPWRPGQRLYRTGDQCRVLDNGALRFLGRVDRQIKIRGYRIEPAEIEAKLLSLPDIRQAAVLLNTRGGEQKLVAYVGCSASRGERIRAELAEILPSYMIPSQVIAMDTLPLLPGGKINQAALPSVSDETVSAGSDEVVANTTEALLLECWKQALGRTDVSRQDNFFALGGDSILSLRVVAFAREKGLLLSAGTIARYPSVMEAALHVRPLEDKGQKIGSDAAEASSVLDPARYGPNTKDVFPMSSLQQGLVFHTELEGNSGVYVNQQRIRLGGTVDIALLRSVWEAALARHDVLRVRFSVTDQVQIVEKQATLPWSEFDWSNLSSARYTEQRREWDAQDKQQPFDLAQAPLMRIAVFRGPGQTVDMVWTAHHAITDGWGSAALLAEIVRDYEARHAGRVSTFPATPSLQDLMTWRASQPNPQAWWQERLEERHDPVVLTEALARPEAKGYGFRTITQILDDKLTRDVPTAAARYGTTPSVLMQAAWGLLLARMGGRSEVAFGVTVSGRPPELSGAERMPGLMINTLPLWIDIPPEERIAAWIRRLHVLNSELREREYTSLSDIQKWSGLRGNALFDSLVVYENYPLADVLKEDQFASGLKVVAVQSEEHSHYPLSLGIVPGRWLEVRWTFDTDAVGIGDVGRLTTLHFKILEQLVDPEMDQKILADIDVPSNMRQREPVVYPFEAVTRRIAAQAAARPDAVAVTCEGQSLSYGALDGWSSQIGRRLLALGVVPDERVGLCVERSTGLIAGLLGILRAGGAYVPLDPAYPRERLADMIADSGMRRVVVDDTTPDSLGDLLDGLEIVRLSDVASENGSPLVTPVHPDQLA
ncbi:amino acid adenylation domain-containing protein, partial [Acetobacter senegalensis]|uniref:non-ribosomal peptide synthetase n=1 Tax=Acetobacter senegalensis TaxID=446692 RepID=UPI0020A14187